MLTRKTSNEFDREYVKQHKRGKDIKKIDELMKLIIEEKPLPPKYKDHALKGNWRGYRDCHIEPNWLLIYKVGAGIAFFARTGSHTDIFG